MFEIKTSSIHGKGLFATQLIPEGAIIGVIEGRPTREDGPHVLWITDDMGIDVRNAMRYINHSPRPNAAYFDDGEVIALQAITPGEEITHNYGGGDEPCEFEAVGVERG